MFHLDYINVTAFNAKSDRLFDFDRNDNIAVNIEELNISPDNIGFVIVNNDNERGLDFADESIHFIVDTRIKEFVWNSNGAVDRGGNVLAYLVAESEFSERYQIEFV